MQIILARHGKPKLPAFGWISPRQMKDWIECYNRAEIEAESIPVKTKDAATASGVVVSSTAPRCIQSIQALGCKAPIITETVFLEADLPYLTWRVPKFPASVWAVMFRLAWLRGFSANAESRPAAVLRAKIAADRLITLAQEHKSVFLMGHGVMAALIADHLRALGWVGSSRSPNKYWGFSVYHLPA
jgi:broad specificity phosphatase PhoE